MSDEFNQDNAFHEDDETYYNSPLSNKWTLVMKIVQAHDCGMSCFFAEIFEGIYREFFHFFPQQKIIDSTSNVGKITREQAHKFKDDANQD